MNKIELRGLDLTCYQEVLSNGLHVFMIPFDKVNAKYASLTTSFNSTIVEFVPEGKNKYRKVPSGIAHFLEHQMFSQSHRQNPMEFYSEHSCDCNAYTSKKKTSYVFSGTTFFEEGLNFLLDYVQDPMITEETVQKEKGIITEELKMYEDKPYSRLYDQICLNTFHSLPFRYPIGGRVEDVEKTTHDEIMDCYHTFYHPSNMFLAITGNINPEEVIEIIKKNQEAKQLPKLKQSPRVKKYKEPVTVYKDFEKIKMDVTVPKICLGIKVDVSEFNDQERDKISYYLNFAFWVNFGATSDFKEEMIKEGIITHSMSYSKERVEDFFFINCVADTFRYEELLKRVVEKLEHLTITEEELERMKRVVISDCIFESDDMYGMNQKIMMEYLQYGKIVEDRLSMIRNLNQKEFYEYMKRLNLKHRSVVVIEPIKKG